MLTVGSLFSGVGGIELGLELCGVGPPLWFCEMNPFSRAVLEDRWPGVPIYRDVGEVDGRAARPDLICGGFPCQDVSVAGEGAGLGGDRSGLWWQFRRVVRQLRPRLVFIENVHAGWRRWLPVVRRSLWRIGYASVPIRVSAADVGAPHERARVFVLAHAHGDTLRDLEQRLPGGWPRGLRDPGQTEPAGDGDHLADAIESPELEPHVQRAASGRRRPGPGQAPVGGGGRGRDHLADGPGPGLERRGQGLSRLGGGPGDVADGDGGRRESLGQPEQNRLDRESGHEPHGRYHPGWQFPPGPAALDGWDGPQPAIRRATDGLSRWMDRARLEALGNAVVPHAAARAWVELTAGGR